MTERMDEQPPENGRTMPLSQEYIDYVLARRRKEDLAAEAERANAALRRARRELETAERALKAGALKMVETGQQDDLPKGVSFVKRSRLVYDADEVLRDAIRLGHERLVKRVAPSLRKADFVREYRKEPEGWRAAHVEEVNAPTIAIRLDSATIVGLAAVFEGMDTGGEQA